MKAEKDEKGRWPPGVSGNPAGRPRGSRDKKRRFRFETKPRPPGTSNLGTYLVRGGPGRGKGTRDRPDEERLAEAGQILDALETRKDKNVPLSGIIRVLKALPKRPKRTDSGKNREFL